MLTSGCTGPLPCGLGPERMRADIIHRPRSDGVPSGESPCSAGYSNDTSGLVVMQSRQISIRGVNLEFAPIPAGSYRMGNPEKPEQFPVVEHDISAFFAAEIPTTRELWRVVMNSAPWEDGGNDTDGQLPVTQVTKHDAEAFCQQVSQELGITARLPSDAQWEYMCRAGTPTRFFWGDDIAPARAFAVYAPDQCRSSDALPVVPVKTKRPNQWGLYDILGTVDEWVADQFPVNPLGPYLTAAMFPAQPKDFIGQAGPVSIIRGGSFMNTVYSLEVYSRTIRNPGRKGRDRGFRIIINA
jgi:formylglycine-generating enzyme required for sulfatase activity